MNTTRIHLLQVIRYRISVMSVEQLKKFLKILEEEE